MLKKISAKNRKEKLNNIGLHIRLPIATRGANLPYDLFRGGGEGTPLFSEEVGEVLRNCEARDEEDLI